MEHLRPGSKIGRYRLEARLGEGAMGVVWSAHDPKLDRDVAIKLVHAALASDEASTRLTREAKAMAKLSHRSVITVYDVDEVDGQLFIAMELVRGTTLGSLLRDRDAAAIADWRRWLALLLEAGRGLAEAHRNGVLHRDFKPDNVLVDASGRVCVGDFGLALLGESLANRSVSQSRQWIRATASPDDSATSLDLTTTGALLGTPVYMGPQQLRGDAIDARGDQFAFCVATWEALYGTRPFVVSERGLEAVVALITAIENGPPSPTHRFRIKSARCSHVGSPSIRRRGGQIWTR
jgi:serine/threonine-protein kinase